MIRIYLADTEVLEPDMAHGISKYREERLLASGSLRMRQEGLGAELLLNLAINEALPNYKLPADIIIGENGKPELSDKSLFFSLSHSEGFSACAVAGAPLGLDIQKASPLREKLMRRVCSEAEQNFVLCHPDPAYAFTMLWVMKESIVKYSGKGIGELLNRPDVLDMKGLWHAVYGDYHVALYYPYEAELEAEITEIKLPRN